LLLAPWKIIRSETASLAAGEAALPGSVCAFLLFRIAGSSFMASPQKNQATRET
jgi:hypothetical protein